MNYVFNTCTSNIKVSTSSRMSSLLSTAPSWDASINRSKNANLFLPPEKSHQLSSIFQKHDL